MFFETTPRYTQTFAAMTSERMRHTRFSASSSTRWAKSSLSTLIQEYLRRLRATIPSSKNQFRDLQTYTQKGHTNIKNTKETTHQPSNLVPHPPKKKKLIQKKNMPNVPSPVKKKTHPTSNQPTIPNPPKPRSPNPQGDLRSFQNLLGVNTWEAALTAQALRWILPRKKTSTQKKTCRNNRWMWSFHSLVSKIKQMYVTYIYICWNPPKKKVRTNDSLLFSIFLPSFVRQFYRKTCKSRDGRRTHSGCQTFPWLCGLVNEEKPAGTQVV